MIPLVDLKSEYSEIKKDIKHNILKVIDSGAFILGSEGEDLEQSIAQYLGVSYGIGVANGTDALLLALEAMEVGPGDEVITTPFTFFATAEVIARVGAKPVFIDIDSASYNMNPDLIEQAITSRTKAIIVVHLFGQPAEMYRIMDIARSHQLRVIEDACQAIGASFQGHKVGSFGDAACFSFFPSKNLGAYGDGGLVVTSDHALYKKICMLRNHGSEQKYMHSIIGYNSRLDEIQAAVLHVKFAKLDEWNTRRRVIANRYSEQLSGYVKTPFEAPHRESVYHQYCVELDQRNELATYLNDKGIASAIYYLTPLHLQKAFAYLGYNKGDFPKSEQASLRILALPMNPFLSAMQVDYIISTIRKYMGDIHEKH